MKKKEVLAKIFGKQYRINCPDTLVDELETSIHFLDKKMQEISEKNFSSKNRENIAILAALHLTHELLLLKSERENPSKKIDDRLQKLHKIIEEALA